MTHDEITARGFKIEAVPRVDMRPRRIIEVRLSNELGYVSLMCSQDAYETNIEAMYDTLMVRFHTEVAPIPDFGRGDVRVVDFF